MTREKLSVAPGSLAAWVLAVRPWTLLAGAGPVLVGTAVAYHGYESIRIGAAIAALFGALFIQIGTNLANDVFDYEKGADTQDRKGPIRVTQAGLLTPGQVRKGMVASFVLAVLTGLYLTVVAGPMVVVIGVVSIAAGIAYTAGPWALAYNGLGDVFVFVFFGPVAVCGTAYVETGTVPTMAWALSIAIGALATAVLVVNNLRDRVTDQRAGKKTLVVRFGQAFGLGEYVALLLLAVAVPVVLVARERLPVAGLAVVPWVAWQGGRCIGKLVKQPGSENECLKKTLSMLGVYAAILCAVLVLDRP